MGKLVFIWPKINTFELFFKPNHWIFLMAVIKKWFNVIVLIFMENSYYVQNGVNEAFLGPKSAFFKFSLNPTISFF